MPKQETQLNLTISIDNRTYQIVKSLQEADAEYCLDDEAKVLIRIQRIPYIRLFISTHTRIGSNSNKVYGERHRPTDCHHNDELQ